MVSLNVTSDLTYQAAVLGWMNPPGPFKLLAQMVTSEKSPKSAGGRSRDREVRPLPLRLDAEMVAGLLESRLHGPALNEPSENLDRSGVEVG